MMQYIIGVDIGTSGTKAIAYAATGEVLAKAYKSYEPVNNSNGHHELRVEDLFNAVITVISTIQQQLGKTEKKLLGISFSSFMHGLILVDENNSPLTNLITWADARSSKQVAIIQQQFQDSFYTITGVPVHAALPICKILWYKQNQPELFARAAAFISIKEYVFHRFFGSYVIDYSVAGATGFFDINTKNWDEGLLRFTGIVSTQLSTPVDTNIILNGIQHDLAFAMRIAVNTNIIIGASDGCLANLGSHAMQKNEAAVTIGTSSAVRITSSAPLLHMQPVLFNYYLMPEKYIVGGATNNGANIVEWYVQKFLSNSKKNIGELIDDALQISPGCNGLLMLPYLHGERAPVWNASAKGVFFGIQQQHTPMHFFRSILEAICFTIAQLIELIEKNTGCINVLHASGGFIQSNGWLQLLADITGKPIQVLEASDASAKGAAMLGLMALGEPKSVEQIQSTEKQIFPDMQLHFNYANNKKMFAKLYQSLQTTFTAMDELP